MANFYGDDRNEFNGNPFTNFYGGNGNDVLKGAGGANELYGGAGSDVLTGGNALSQSAPVEVTGTGGSADDPIRFAEEQQPSGNDTLEGGSGVDGLYGFDGDDVLDGGQGDDGGIIATGDGTSFYFYVGGLFGGEGNDTIYGGDGDDEINGGLGTDDMYGGKDSDTFIFGSSEEIGKGSASDSIGDFNFKQGDVIDLALIDAKEGKNGDQAFKYIGDDGFHDKQGELQFKNGKLKGDTDGDGKADFVLIVNNTKITDDHAFHL